MTQHADRLTEDQYLERERSAAGKSEFVGGVVVAMGGASARHNAIVANAVGMLGTLLRARPCIVLASDQRVHAEATGLYAYPDVTVVCEAPRFHSKGRDTLLNPTLLVEVLSSSTEAYDRGAKFAHYRSIPGLQELLLVAQEEQRVEHYRRIETGQWLLTEYVGGAASVTLPALGIELPMAELYAKTESLTDRSN